MQKNFAQIWGHQRRPIKMTDVCESLAKMTIKNFKIVTSTIHVERLSMLLNH